MSRPSRSLSRCLVCGFSEVRTDEVVDGGVLYLGWCPRCDHRWTRAEPVLRPAGLPTAPQTRPRAA